MQVFSTTVPQHQHSRNRLCFPQPMGKRFSTAMWLLAKVSVHFASLLCSILMVTLCVVCFFFHNAEIHCSGYESPTNLSDFIPILPVLLKETTCEYFGGKKKKFNSIVKKINLKSPENGRQLQILFGRVTMVITLPSRAPLS